MLKTLFGAAPNVSFPRKRASMGLPLHVHAMKRFLHAQAMD
jgi:hypothetical protein